MEDRVMSETATVTIPYKVAAEINRMLLDGQEVEFDLCAEVHHKLPTHLGSECLATLRGTATRRKAAHEAFRAAMAITEAQFPDEEQ